MLLRSLINEAEINYDELEAFKGVIAGKIKQLPADDATAKTLKEIEDLLKHVHAGGKLGIINGELRKIDDPTVNAAQKILAQYIYSLEMSPDEREELFSLWREDKLVNRKKLLSVGKHTFNDIFKSYDSNNGIKRFVDEIMKIAALGQGKGEFGLSVLSKEINRPKSKGDLIIDDRKIEVKTFDKAAARFTDQNVFPADGYAEEASKLEAFVRARDPELIPTAGLNLMAAIKFGTTLASADRKKYFALVHSVIKLIFGGDKANGADVNAVVTAIKEDKPNEAKQAYARANFNYYMSMKEDEGVLYLNIQEDPGFSIFYRTADDLASIGQRFDAETNYITSKTFREIYPKIKIVDTTFGANAKAKAEKDKNDELTKAAKANPVATPDRDAMLAQKRKKNQVMADIEAFATNFAHRNKIYNPMAIDRMSQFVLSWLSSGMKTTAMNKQLNQLVKDIKAQGAA